MRLFKAEDLVDVNAWYVGHGMPALRPSVVPKVGLVQPGVAAGFLYETDSGICMLEGYVTSPEAGPKARNAALDEITDSLLGYAQEIGFKHAIAICRDSAVEKRAAKHGFGMLGRFALMAKEI